MEKTRFPLKEFSLKLILKYFRKSVEKIQGSSKSDNNNNGKFNVCKSLHHRAIQINHRPRTHHDCHHDKKVKPETASAVTELLMMGGTTPETCWAVNKRQDNKLENCCIWLVIYLNNWYFTWRTIYVFNNISLTFFRMKSSLCSVNVLISPAA
jgi:hypothetical protein